jgi:molybdopterin-guanine dinucleotide biosynthesis protein A
MERSLEQLTAILMCGGRSSRMGIDKSQLLIGDQTFAQVLCNRLEGFSEVIISSNDDALDFLNKKIIKDEKPGCGPLGGILSSLRACITSYAFVLACDMPRFSVDIVEHLWQDSSANAEIIVPRSSDGRIHPLCAVYKASLITVIEDQIGRRDLKMVNLINRCKTCIVDFPFADSFLNINSPEEYLKYQKSTHHSN